MARDPNTGERLSRAEASARIRQNLLETGVEMVLEQPVAPGLDHIRVTEVARRAGVTTGAVYHHWESQDHFRAEVLELLLDDAETAEHDTWAEALSNPEAKVVPALEQAVEAELRHLASDARFTAFLSFWARRGDESVSTRVAATYRARTERRAELLRRALDHQGVELQPPFTPFAAVTLLSSFVEGLALRGAPEDEATGVGGATVDPEAIRAGTRALLSRILEGAVIDIDADVPADKSVSVAD